MPAGNNNFVDTDAKIKDFLNAVLSSEGIVVDIRRTFINYNGVNRSRVFARRANEMASKGGNEKFVVIALMCYPALQWILQAQDIDRLVEELREQNPDESVSRMSNIQRVLESSLGGCKPQLRLEMRKVFFARCQQLVDAVDEAMNAAVFHNPKSKAGKISLAMALLRGSILETDPVTAVTIEEIVLDKDNGYGTVLKDMPKYKNGVEIDYQIKDFKVDGYTTNIIKGDSVKDFKVTNTHVPEMVTVTVTEGWHDQSDYDKIRPEEIALTLTGSDGNVYEKTVNKETWTAVFSDLPKNRKGEQIIYTLTQEGIKGYSTTITNNQTDTITVINKHEPVKTITVTVTWNDENNKDSIRPDKVTVKLTDGTTVVSTKEVKNDSWKHIFEDIPVFNGSDKVSYTITQDAVNGYTTEIKASDDGNTIEIINTHIPVVPPKEEPKKEEPATPAPVVEVKVEQPAPTVTLIQTTNKPTGISFFESLFAK